MLRIVKVNGKNVQGTGQIHQQITDKVHPEFLQPIKGKEFTDTYIIKD